MLEFLAQDDADYLDASQGVMQAIEHILQHGPKTADIGGSANTEEVGDAIAAWLATPTGATR